VTQDAEEEETENVGELGGRVEGAEDGGKIQEERETKKDEGKDRDEDREKENKDCSIVFMTSTYIYFSENRHSKKTDD
jgi:hypothetical protein